MSTRPKPFGLISREDQYLVGRIGDVTARWSACGGGLLELRYGVPGKTLPVVLGTGVQLPCTNDPTAADCSQTVTLRQANDGAPQFTILDLGPERIGLRTLYLLYDDLGHYHGDGMQETWIYADGEVFLSVGLRMVDPVSHPWVEAAWLEIEFLSPSSEAQVEIGSSPPRVLSLSKCRTGAFVPFGHVLPGKYLMLKDGKAGKIAAYWRADRGRLFNPHLDYRPLERPNYEKWPPFSDQWDLQLSLYDTDHMDAMGWRYDESSGLKVRSGYVNEHETICTRLYWFRDGRLTHSVRKELRALLVIAASQDEEALHQRMRWHQEPLSFPVKGGRLRCYDEIEGCYEITKDDPKRVEIILPPDAEERQIRLRFYKLQGVGGITLREDGEQVIPHIISEGGRTDDPQVPLLLSSHAPADEAIYTTQLARDREKVVILEEGLGINASYQMWDDVQSVILFASHSPGRGLLEFSLRDAMARHIYGPGKAEEAVSFWPLHWDTCPLHSPFHAVNQPRGFELLENGPYSVRFRYSTGTFSDRARSEYEVTVPFREDVTRITLTCKFTVTSDWYPPRLQFYDLFPFDTSDDRAWHYTHVLHLDQQGRIHNVPTKAHGETLERWEFSDGAFFAFHASDRGNVLTLVKNPSPPDVKMSALVCSMWIDLHLDIVPDRIPVPAGSSFSVELITDVMGDGTITKERLLEIGRRSLEIGDIVY